MVDPIKHTTTSALSTTGVETIKGAAEGALLIPALAAVAGAVVVGGLVSLAPVSLTVIGLSALGGALAAGIPTTITMFSVGLPVTGTLAAIGGVLGLTKGGERVGKENNAAENKIAKHMAAREDVQAQAANMGLQQGYVAGFQEGRNQVINQVMQAQAEAQAQAPAAGHADKFKKAGSHVAAVAESKANETGMQR